jgi:hypothetical protein
MNNDFYLMVKSTLDNLGYAMASALSAQAVDLDDRETADTKLTNTEPSVLWQLLGVSPAPLDPMYEVTFLIGAKTTRDPGSYKLVEFNSALNQTVHKGSGINIHDYSGASAGPQEGVLYVTDVDLAPQQDGDPTSGIRFMMVSCKGLRFP